MKQLAAHTPLRLNSRLFFLLLLAMAGLSLSYATWQDYQAAHNEAVAVENEVMHIAQAAMRHQQAILGETSQLLRILGSVSVAEARNPDACRNFLARQLERFSVYDNLAFLRSDHSIFCSAHPLPALTGTDSFSISGTSVLLVFHADEVVAILPRQGGMDDMRIAAFMPLREFLFGRTNPLPANADFAVMDAAGKVIAASPSRRDWSLGLTRSLPGLESGIATRRSANGNDGHLYVVQPLPGTIKPLWLAIRVPADAGDALARQTLLWWSALALAAFVTWLLGRTVIQRALFGPKREDRTRLGGLSSPIHLPAPFRAPHRSQNQAQRPGETTLLRQAYDKLKRAFADKEAHMQQIIALDALSCDLQKCGSMIELAQAVERCATDLFPGSSGVLLRRTLTPQIEAVHSWGDPSAVTGKITLPLIASNESLGILNLTGIDDYDPWTTTSLAERTAAGMLMLKCQAQLHSRAIHDRLTGLYNRHFLEEAVAIELHRALSRGTPVGVLMLDIDYFKRFNDTHGHDAGDGLLRGIGALLRQAVREGDMPCRYGGEEFVVILPGADLAGTRQRAEALRAAIATWQPQLEGQSLGPVTVSVGVASMPTHGSSWPKLLKAADKALYASKHGGRNRVTAAPIE